MKVREIIQENGGFMSGRFSQQWEKDVPLCHGVIPRIDRLPLEENPRDFDVVGIICPTCGKVLACEDGWDDDPQSSC